MALNVMIVKEDALVRSILKEISISKEPLETKEIELILKKTLKNISRTKVVYRLNNLRGEGLVKGKYLGSGKGVWIWWNPNMFSRKNNASPINLINGSSDSKNNSDDNSIDRLKNDRIK